MKLNKCLHIFFIILFIAYTGCSRNKSNINDEVIAKVDKDYVITLKDLKKYISDWNYVRRFHVKSVAYKKALNDLIINQLKIIDFFDRKLNENKDLMKKIRRYINHELINTYFDREFMEKYVNEKNEERAYKEMGKEIIYEEIILPIPQKVKKERLDSLNTVAMNIQDGLNKGYDINALINIDSLKNIIVNNKKNMTWSQSMIDPVGNVIFKLKKGYTRVIKSLDGFHIVKVLDIKKVKLEPFEKMKDEIKSKLKKGYYFAYNKEYDNYRLGLIDKNSLKWNQKGLEQIVKWSSEDTTFYGGAYQSTIQKAILNGHDFEILSYNKGRVDLKEYLRLLEGMLYLNRNVVLNAGNVKDFILNAVYDDNVVKAAQELGLEKELVNPNTKDPLIRDRLIYLYNQAVIDGSIPEATPEALQKFYKDQKDSIFYQLKKINIYARIYSDSTEAAADINEIKKGIPFEKVSSNWWNKAFIRERDGSLESYRSHEPPYLAKAAMKLKLNECAGPIEYYDSAKGKQFAVIKCVYIQPEKQLTYEEVKGKRIENEFNNYYLQKISDEVDAKLKKKYGVKIFQNALSEAISAK